MGVYISFDEDGKLQKVHSPDNATAFTEVEAEHVRGRAYSRWPSCDWQVKKVAADTIPLEAPL